MTTKSRSDILKKAREAKAAKAADSPGKQESKTDGLPFYWIMIPCTCVDTKNSDTNFRPNGREFESRVQLLLENGYKIADVSHDHNHNILLTMAKPEFIA